MVANQWRTFLKIFRDDNDVSYADQLTATQLQIIDIIAARRYPRTQLILPTQYGKSLAVALGVLTRVASHRENWAIVAPSEEKARIIMDYIIDHIFDHEMFYEQLEYYGTKEKLKQERSKVRITFRNGGEVRVYSGNATNTKATKSALMGFGAANVVLDESGLISDELYATVKRMLGGSKDNFLLEIGNPFNNNHFKKTWFGTLYKKIFVDIYMALAEGRYTTGFVEEMREEAFFDVLYECLFPAEEEVLANGYRRLLLDSIVDAAKIPSMPELNYKLDPEGARLKNEWGFEVVEDKAVLGIDVSGTGANQTKFILRLPKHNFAKVEATLGTEDLDIVADKAIELAHLWNIGDYRVIYDAGGVGHGLRGLLRDRGMMAKAVLFGEKAPDKTFVNVRAWMYWQARVWLNKEAGKLVDDPGFDELKLIYYKRNANDRTLMEPKAEMILRNSRESRRVASPDTADGFVLTFVDTSTIVEEEDIADDDDIIDEDEFDDDDYEAD